MKDEILTEYAIKGVVAVLIFVAVYVFIAFSVYSCLSNSEKEEVQNIEMQRCHVTKLRERVRMKDTLDDRISALYESLLVRAKILLSGDVEMARDLTSDVILRMLSNKDKFEDGTNLNAWGYTILKNSFINLHKRYGNKTFLRDNADEEERSMFERLDLLTEDTDDYSRSLDVRSAIAALPEIYRVPINYLICGYRYEEIANIMGIEMNTLKSRIFHARKKLTKVLTD